jgi:hypothetical protein
MVIILNTNDLSKNLVTMGSTASTADEVQEAWAQHFHDKNFMGWLRATSCTFAKGSIHTTQDLVQEALLQIRLAAPNYTANGDPFAWRKKVVRNHLINLTKKRKGKWNYPSQFRNGNGIEKFIGDDPSLPP